MLLVSSVDKTERLDVEDSCPHCLDRLSLKIENAELTTAHPPSIYAFYGGG